MHIKELKNEILNHFACLSFRKIHRDSLPKSTYHTIRSLLPSIIGDCLLQRKKQ